MSPESKKKNWRKAKKNTHNIQPSTRSWTILNSLRILNDLQVFPFHSYARTSWLFTPFFIFFCDFHFTFTDINATVYLIFIFYFYSVALHSHCIRLISRVSATRQNCASSTHDNLGYLYDTHQTKPILLHLLTCNYTPFPLTNNSFPFFSSIAYAPNSVLLSSYCMCRIFCITVLYDEIWIYCLKMYIIVMIGFSEYWTPFECFMSQNIELHQ